MAERFRWRFVEVSGDQKGGNFVLSWCATPELVWTTSRPGSMTWALAVERVTRIELAL
ncbi:hypothetical protein [Streptomyces sp. NPDC102282]|uniref:hypothetical protein n=1 Tax=Streptomyces sp. NPDC102282 TaxID=3366154 RepID=UPI0038171866